MALGYATKESHARRWSPITCDSGTSGIHWNVRNFNARLDRVSEAWELVFHVFCPASLVSGP